MHLLGHFKISLKKNHGYFENLLGHIITIQEYVPGESLVLTAHEACVASRVPLFNPS